VGATAILVSYHLAFWPAFPYGSDDADTWRWGWGLAANGLLILVLLLAVRKSQKSTLGWLLVFAIAGTIMFAVIRTPHGLPGHVWALYWPTVMAVTAGILVILAAVLARTENWQALFEPVYLTGVAIMPIGAIGGILFGAPQLMPSWVPAVSFACLAVVYVLAAVLVGPRTFVAVAVLCGAMSFWRLQDATGWARIAPFYYQAMLVSLSIGLWAWVTYRRQPRRVLQLIRWAGIAVAVASIVAGLIASRR
jgi:peptidoglycan/LPS O-acetylase OafA/YrhL